MAKDKKDKEEPKKEGRPLMQLTDLPEGWEQNIIDLSTEGASIVELAVALDISRNTLKRLTKDNPEFLTTIKKCKRLCEVWWVREGRTNLKDKDFNYTGWYMNMKNRFGWKDKTENDQKITISNPPKIEFTD